MYRLIGKVMGYSVEWPDFENLYIAIIFNFQIYKKVIKF